MNFCWVDEEVMVGGVVVSDLPLSTSASRKRRRSEVDSHVRRIELERAIGVLHADDKALRREADRERKQNIRDKLNTASFRAEIVGQLRSMIELSLNQSHDFRALLTQIRANASVILTEQFPDLSNEEAAENLENVGAIYYTTELMVGKIDATKFLYEPNLVFGRERVFSVHPFILKLVRIYGAYAKQRDIKIAMVGASYGTVYYNSDAIGSIVQAILDNAVKYAPVGSTVTVAVSESRDRIGVSCSSLGPAIKPEEEEMIFQPGFRAEAARGMQSGGQGFGLAAAMSVSDAINLGLGVEQESVEDARFPKYFKTTFMFGLDRRS